MAISSKPNPKVPKVILMGSLKTIEKLTKEKNKNIKFPMHFWTTDTKQYGYLNIDGSLCMTGYPKLTGTISKPIIISELDPGIYTVVGEHKIDKNHKTTYLTTTEVFYMVSKTSAGTIKIKRITSATIDDFVIKNGEIEKETYVTDTWLKDNGYVTEGDVNLALDALEVSLKADARSIAAEVFDAKIDDAFAERIEIVGSDFIRELFE